MMTYDKKFSGDRGANRIYIWIYTGWLCKYYILFKFLELFSNIYFKLPYYDSTIWICDNNE